jgi:hypothetical protein
MLVCYGLTVQAEEPPYMLVRVELTPQIDVIPLLELGVDLVDGVKGEYIELVCHPHELAQIRTLGYQTEVKIADMERYYAENSGTTDDMGGYHTWSEAIDEINQVHLDHPTITTEPFSIGQTIEGREMFVIKISDNPDIDEDEPEVFFTALIHAREPIGVELALELTHRLTDHYGIDPYITDLVDTREIFILPVFNVDGYVYNETTNPSGGGMWRKNRRNNGSSYGVDLNRNWGFDWGYNNYGSSPTPSSPTYRGTGPFSEPETENVRQFVDSHNFSVSLFIHSYANKMMYAWSQSHRGYTPENGIFESITQTMQQWNGYVFGTGWYILYEMNGEANDWMYGEQNEKPRVMSWLFEVGSTFWPPASQIPGLVDENIDPCLYLIEIAGDYMSPRVTLTPFGTPIQIPAAGGSFEYNVASSSHAPAGITCDIWVDVTLPDGTVYGPIVGPFEITTPAGSSLNRDRIQSVPVGAPSGTYSYNAYLGIYPDVTWHTDSFAFEKLETGDGMTVYDWFNTGEPLVGADETVTPFGQTQP